MRSHGSLARNPGIDPVRVQTLHQAGSLAGLCKAAIDWGAAAGAVTKPLWKYMGRPMFAALQGMQLASGGYQALQGAGQFLTGDFGGGAANMLRGGSNVAMGMTPGTEAMSMLPASWAKHPAVQGLGRASDSIGSVIEGIGRVPLSGIHRAAKRVGAHGVADYFKETPSLSYMVGFPLVSGAVETIAGGLEGNRSGDQYGQQI